MEAEQKVVNGVAIRFLSGPLAEKTIYIQKPVTVIGRDGQNDIVVHDQRVSRRHACIRFTVLEEACKPLACKLSYFLQGLIVFKGILHTWDDLQSIGEAALPGLYDNI